MAGTTAQGDSLAGRVIAPATALAMLAVQVGATATRDALFLSCFPVTTLPWFVALAAAITFLAAPGTGLLLARYGPTRTVPATFACNGVLFLAEAWLLGPQPRAAAVVLYLHATVLGAITTSTFWSLLSERFDPHSAKGIFSRVAGAATLGAVLGGLSAERVATLQSPGVLLVLLAAGAATCAGGSTAVARGVERVAGPNERPVPGADGDTATGASYVRGLAVVATFAALVGTLCDYMLKADVVGHVSGSASLVGFFGLFYAATGIAAFAIQVAFAPAVLRRLKIADALALHPLAVGIAGVASLVAPSPWRGILPRGADATLRRSLFRTGYELLYTALPDATRRSVKTTIDVGWDCVGSGAGAAVVLLLTRVMPAQHIAAVTVACMVAAGLELACTWRLRSGYGKTLEEKLRHLADALPRVTHYTMDRATMARILSEHGPKQDGGGPRARSMDPIGEAISELRSGDAARIRAALRLAATEPVLVSAVIPLLARSDLLDDVGAALRVHGARVAGQLTDALLASDTPEVVRRRLPLVLEGCASRRAAAGLVDGLSDDSVTVRSRCCRALLKTTATHPELGVSREGACAAAERELNRRSSDERTMARVFDLLALAFDREILAIARRAWEAGDAQALGTALAYLENTLPRALFATLEHRLLAPVPRGR